MRVCGWWSEGRMLRVLVVKVAVVCGEEYSKASARAGRSCPAPQLRGKGAWEVSVARLGSCHRWTACLVAVKLVCKALWLATSAQKPSNRYSIFSSTFTLIAMSCRNVSLAGIPGQSVKVISHLAAVFAFRNLVYHINAIQRCVFFSALLCSMGVKPRGEGNHRSCAIFPTSRTSNLQMSQFSVLCAC